jgi:putative ABC transport system substrate-binding protein
MNEKVICLALGAMLLALSFRVEAQQTAKMRRIGLLLPNTPEIVARSPRIQAFFQGLQDFGWIEGQNFTVERRFAEGQFSPLADLAIELASLKVDVIVTAAAPSAKAAKDSTGTIPIVILDPGDPVGTGLVASLARPGGNVTGVTSIAPDLAGKRLGCLRRPPRKFPVLQLSSTRSFPPRKLR